jgi:thiamine-monophosphate kinase
MKIKDFGEFNIIDYISNSLNNDVIQSSLKDSLNISIGVGDDTAVWDVNSKTQLATTDTMVDKVHFDTERCNLVDIGWKAMATNLSDIASMAGVPTTALITLGLPGEMELSEFKNLYQGIIECASTYNTTIIGGDIVKSPILFITVALYGVNQNIILTRSSLNVGDFIGITDFTGLSKGGFELASKSEKLYNNISEENRRLLLNSHFRPKPKIDDGTTLANLGATSAMDISDGLFSDLNKMLVSSQLSAEINYSSIPIHPVLSQIFPESAFEMATNGGEDYELLFGISSDKLDSLNSLLPNSHIIGQACSGNIGIIELTQNNKVYKLDKFDGWDHFKQ